MKLQQAGARFVGEYTLELRMCTRGQVAEMLGVEPEWVTDYLSEFPGAIRLDGGDLRIPYSDVEEALVRWRMRPEQARE